MSDRRLTLPARFGSRGIDVVDPVDVAEAAALEADRELDLPRRHRLDVDRELASERVAIGNIEQRLEERTCVYCPERAELTCVACGEWLCDDDDVDGFCPDCLGLRP